MTGRISDLALSQISEAIRDNTSVTHILMNLQVQETTFRSALAAAETALQRRSPPSCSRCPCSRPMPIPTSWRSGSLRACGFPSRPRLPVEAVGPAGKSVPSVDIGRRRRCRFRRPFRRGSSIRTTNSTSTTRTAERLGLIDAEEAIVLAVVTLRDRPADATLNLLGPIVVNRHTHEAAQVVLPTTTHSVRAPLAFAG
jgi:hypothetical protein